MKISGGMLKGRKLGSQKLFAAARKGEGFRPTSSKVREALFDILRPCLAEAAFVDLYAGTGTVGIEALSRGASRVWLVESDAVRAREIQRFIERAGLEGKAFLQRMPARDFIRNAQKAEMTFEIVFADPPYASEETASLPELLESSGIVSAGGSVVIEHSAKLPLLVEGLRSLCFIKSYRYGDTMLTLCRREP